MELDGEPAFTGILHDLSRRVAIEEALRKSEERLRSIVESAVDAIIVIDDRGLIQAFNPSAERLFGYTVSDVIGRNVSTLMPSPDREQHDGYLRHYLETGEQKIIGIGREVTGLKKDGTRFPVHLSVGEMVSEGKRSFTGNPPRSERSRRARAAARRTEIAREARARWRPSSRTK